MNEHLGVQRAVCDSCRQRAESQPRPPTHLTRWTSFYWRIRVESHLERRSRGEAPGATARSLLLVSSMRRRVCPRKELCAAACGGLDEGRAVLLALQDRQAVVVRPQPALHTF
jgi:hypothetical protein